MQSVSSVVRNVLNRSSPPLATKKALMLGLVHMCTHGKYGEARKSMRRTIRHEPRVVKRARTTEKPERERDERRYSKGAGADGSFMQGTIVNQSRAPSRPGVTTGGARVIERERVQGGTINIVFASVLRTFMERYTRSVSK